MSLVVLKDKGLDTQHYAPSDKSGITSLTSGKSPTTQSANPLSTGFIGYERTDGTNERVNTLTTDIVNFRLVNSNTQLQFTVRKLLGDKVEEHYPLTVHVPFFPVYNRTETDKFFRAIRQYPKERRQEIVYFVKSMAQDENLKLDYSDFPFSNSIILVRVAGDAVRQTGLTDGKVGIDITAHSAGQVIVIIEGIY